MTIDHEPMAVLDHLLGYDARPAEMAASCLAFIDPSGRELFLAHVYGAVIQFRSSVVKAPRGPEVVQAIEAMVAALEQVDRSLEILFRARETASRKDARGKHRRSLYPAAINHLTRAVHSPAIQWDEGATQMPLRGVFKRCASDIATLASRRTKGDLHLANRPDCPAFDCFVGQLANAYEAATGKTATASRKGNDRTYRGPFSKMVAAIWPAASEDPPPTNKVIAGALSRQYPLIPLRSARIKGYRIEPESVSDTSSSSSAQDR